MHFYEYCKYVCEKLTNSFQLFLYVNQTLIYVILVIRNAEILWQKLKSLLKNINSNL